MTWTSFRVESGSAREAVLAALFAAGAQGVHEDGAALITHFPADTDVAAIARTVQRIDPRARVVTGAAADTDWSEAWRAALSVQQVGALAIAPPWLAGGLDPSRTIVIDPGMAFGTGEHATTRGVVRLAQSALRPGDRVADLGAGSAVLAITAAKLGARRVTAVEIDPDALGNARENVERNGVAHLVHLVEGDARVLLPLLAPLDLVLANIISSVHIDLLPAIDASLAPGGRAVLGGILVEERQTLLDVFDASGWAITAEAAEEIWWSATITRR